MIALGGVLMLLGIFLFFNWIDIGGKEPTVGIVFISFILIGLICVVADIRGETEEKITIMKTNNLFDENVKLNPDKIWIVEKKDIRNKSKLFISGEETVYNIIGYETAEQPTIEKECDCEKKLEDLKKLINQYSGE